MALRLPDGGEIPSLPLSSRYFLNRSTALFGPSGSGKTVVVKHIMELLRPHISQVLVVSPTEPSNQSYAGHVHPSCIHLTMSLPPSEEELASKGGRKKKEDTPKDAALRFLRTVWERQGLMSAIYSRANDPEILGRLYERLSHDLRREGDRFLRHLDRLSRKAEEEINRRYPDDPGVRDEKTRQIQEMCAEQRTSLQKRLIHQQAPRLWRTSLDEDERHALTYHDFNPRLLLILDDCASDLPDLFRRPEFTQLFYMGRHRHITLLLPLQDDTNIPPALRKNIFTSIFTTPRVATAYFARPGTPKAVRTQVEAILNTVFVPSAKHRKFVYLRDDPDGHEFYHFTAQVHPRRYFGSAAFLELCEQVQDRERRFDTGNQFYSHFFEQ